MLVQVNPTCLIIGYEYNSLKLMATGVAGGNGLAAPRHAGLEKEAGQETATTQFQLMEAATVKD